MRRGRPGAQSVAGSITIGRRPVRLCTRLAMCSVPPGPSPAAPSHKRHERDLGHAVGQGRVQHPAVASVVLVHPLGWRPQLVVHDQDRPRLGRDLGERALPAVVGVGEGHRIAQEEMLGLREAQLDLHAAREAGLREQEVAAAGAAADAEIAVAGTDPCRAPRRSRSPRRRPWRQGSGPASCRRGRAPWGRRSCGR